MKKILSKILKILKNKYFLSLVALGVIATVCLYIYVHNFAKPYIFYSIDNVPPCYTALVLGAKVHPGGAPSNYLSDRLDAALDLYHAHKIQRFLLSGDHGTKNYDEVNVMKDYLLTRGVDTCNVFLDHAGFDTYNSIVRAKEIFQAQEMIIVSQNFHLSRAVYIAQSKGLKAYGFCADRSEYKKLTYLKFREAFAEIKAFFEVKINSSPKFLGAQIPITGDSRKSYDR